jgi:hypothetical protein
MSSSNRPASTASAVSHPSTVDFGGYLDRVYDSEAANSTHLKAAKALHQAQVAMMRSKRAVRARNDELAKATAAAASATELVDRKRKAMLRRMTLRRHRGRYGTEANHDRPSAAPTSPVYRPTSPLYSKVDSKVVGNPTAKNLIFRLILPNFCLIR